MQENYKQKQDRASASLERMQMPQIIELESNTVKLSIDVRCTAPEGWRCDDKQEPNAMCFSLPMPCRFIEFVKVEVWADGMLKGNDDLGKVEEDLSEDGGEE